MVKTIGIAVTLFILLGVATLSGCATMDKSECTSANWEIIGFEDGAAGRSGSYVGQHRSACAEYGVSPDLRSYLTGHKRGLIQYCNYQSGFSLGNQGRSFSNICDGQKGNEFSQGYKKGSQLYALRSEIRQFEQRFANLQDRQLHLTQEIQQKEDLIVAGHTSMRERRVLLQEIDQMRSERDEVEHEIALLEAELVRLRANYERRSS